MSKAQYVTGLRAVEQLLGSNRTAVRKIYAEYQTANPRVEAVIAQANARGIEVQAANRARLKQISGEARHQGLVAEISRDTRMDEAGLRTMVEQQLADDNAKPLLLLILDGVEDPHNLGACLRTADAAGVDAVIVPRHGAAGLTSTVSKVASGAAETVNFVTVANIGRVQTWLQEYGVETVATSDSASKSLYDCDLKGPITLIMGGEGTGLRQKVLERCDHAVKLPMAGDVSSLNVSVATGVCLYEVVRQRRSEAAD